jgi:Putative transmembrane protein (PGPGW)
MTESVSVWSTQPSFSLWRCAGGWALLMLGVAGLILPVLPGTPLIIAGLVILSADHHWARKLLCTVKLWVRKFRRHPPPAKTTTTDPLYERRDCHEIDAE